MLRQRKK